MNKIIIILFLFIITNISFAIERSCVEKKALITYYFLNGVWVKKKEMAKSRKQLQNAFSFDENVDILALYNPTQNQTHWMMSIQSFYSLALDVKEVFNQKQYEFNSLVKDMKSEMRKLTDVALIDNLMTELSPHYNIVFAHSQGNLVAGEMCQRMKDKSKLEVISIASPGSSLPCNTFQTYVLYKNDQVIGNLRRIKDNYGYIKPNIENATIGINHFMDTYLEDPQVINILKPGLDRVTSTLYEQNLNFDLISIKLDTVDEDIHVVDNKPKENISAERKRKTKDITMQFGLSIFDNTFTLAKEKISAKAKNTRDFNKIIDIPINVHSDEEFRDFLLYVKKEVTNICTNLYSIDIPDNFSTKICDYYKEINRKSKNSKYEGMTIAAFDKINSKNITVSCKDIKLGEYPISLDYLASSSKPQEIKINLDSKDYTIKVPSEKKPERTSRSIAQANITLNNNKEYVVGWSSVIDSTEDTSIEQIQSKGSRQTSSVKADYKDCYTFRKLNSPECAYYLEKLFK